MRFEKPIRFHAGGSEGRGYAVRLLLDGIESIPVTYITIQYGVNQIPQAAVFVPLGFDTKTTNLSPIHDAESKLLRMQPARVVLVPYDGDRANEPVNLLVGYVASSSYRRLHGQLGIVVSLSGQLSALTMSSAGSGELVPGAPDDLFTPVHIVSSGGSSDRKSAAAVSAHTHLETILPHIQNNLPRAIFELLHSIASNSALQVGSSVRNCGPVVPMLLAEANKKALEALTANGHWKGFVTPPAAFLVDGLRHTIAMGMCDSVARALSPLHLWGAMIQALAADFGIGCIPLSDRAYLAPILPIGKQEHFTLNASQYTDFQMIPAAVRPLAGVVTLRMTSPGTYGDSQGSARSCVGGFYAPRAGMDLENPGGMWQYVRAPGWLEQLAYIDDPSGDRVPQIQQAFNTASGTAMNPESAIPPVRRDYVNWNLAYERYAQLRYADNLYRGREASVVCPLNLRIPPAVTLRIVSDSPFLSQNSTLRNDFLFAEVFGFVSQVTVTINAQQGLALSSYRLTNVRTAGENEQQGFSMSEHPFFGTFFTGEPYLVEGIDAL